MRQGDGRQGDGRQAGSGNQRDALEQPAGGPQHARRPGLYDRSLELGQPPREGAREDLGGQARLGPDMQRSLQVVAGEQAPEAAAAVADRNRHRGAHAHVGEVGEVHRRHAAQHCPGEVDRRRAAVQPQAAGTARRAHRE